MNRAKRLGGLVALALLTMSCLWIISGPALARHSMSFTPGDRHRPHAAARSRHFGRRSHATARASARPGGRRHGFADGDDGEGPAAKAVPGAGFTMQDGVLTYPAPARFQPQNLKHLH